MSGEVEALRDLQHFIGNGHRFRHWNGDPTGRGTDDCWYSVHINKLAGGRHGGNGGGLIIGMDEL